jgi:hypothetical protein
MEDLPCGSPIRDRLRELRKPLEEQEPQELLALIQEIRRERSSPPEESPMQRKKLSEKARDLIASLDPADREALLRKVFEKEEKD